MDILTTLTDLVNELKATLERQIVGDSNARKGGHLKFSVIFHRLVCVCDEVAPDSVGVGFLICIRKYMPQARGGICHRHKEGHASGTQ